MKKYIVLSIVILFLPTFLSLPIYNDGGPYAYMGTLFFEGKLPYIHGWDHKGISLYFINGLGYLLGFKNLIGIRILEFLLITFSFLQIYNTLKNKFSKNIAFLSVLFGLLAFAYFFDAGNLTEEYTATFILCCMSFLLKAQTTRVEYAIIGFLFVLSFTIRANLIAFWAALFFTLILQAIAKKEQIKTVFKKLIALSLGLISACILLGIYFLATDSFSEFYNAAFTYNFSYSKRSFAQTIGSIITSIRTYEVSILMLLAFLIALISILKKRATFISYLLVFWIPIELYLGNMSGKLYAHYYLMWVPIIVISTAFIADYLKDELISKEKRIVLISITAFLCFQIPLFLTANNYKKLIQGTENNSVKIADHINQQYTNKSILVWGSKAAIYNLTQKRATVPYFYQTFFKVNGPVTEQIIRDFTSQFIQNPPDLVIDAKTPSLLYIDKTNSDKIDTHQKENLKSFFTYLANNYELKEKQFGVDFYVKK